jgi:cation diffusion facilitator CzcD-associated flavoprotein CzcO
VFEAGTDVGGTWYWNRYPGARFDSESWTYGYAFSKALMQEWDWKEHFSPQPDTLAYLNHVADKFDLRRDMQFQSSVKSAHWDDDANVWTVPLESGEQASVQFLFTAIGILSTPTLPAIRGRDSFCGPLYHPGRWPHTPVDFTGKRVGVIGTGATAIQAIPEIVKQAKQLTVFQRRPNWAAPLHNAPISKQEMQGDQVAYDEIYAHCRQTPSCFIHKADSRLTFEASAAEREAFWEKLYAEPGFGIWMGNFRDNVHLVDIKNDEPIESITPNGVKTERREYQFDILLCATGYDGITGAFDQIDFRGLNGVPLKNVWVDGQPRTYLGMLAEGFPNMLMVLGPHTARGNIPQAIEHCVNFQFGLLRFMQERRYSRVETRAEHVAQWTKTVIEAGERLLSAKVDSWQTGVNRNVEGRSVRRILGYNGNGVQFRKKTDEVAKDSYTELNFRNVCSAANGFATK